MTRSAPRPSLLQSPWYWAYAFCAAGLIALLLMGGKFSQRQSQIERQHQGRQRASKIEGGPRIDLATNGNAPAAFAELSTPDSTLISLTPLYALLAMALVASWAALWWTHFRRRGGASQSAEANAASTQGRPS